LSIASQNTPSRRRCRVRRPAAAGVRIALLVALLGATGCAGLRDPLRSDLASPDAEVRACAAWFAALDDAVDRAGVRDAEARPIPGFPYLRVNRFLASFRTRVTDDPAAFAAWEGHLRALDGRARGYELRNLPMPMLSALGADSWTAASARVERCGVVLSQHDAADRTRAASLIARAQVPDDYSDWQQVVGLYPLVRIPFFDMAKDWEQDTTKMFDAAQAGARAAHDVVRYQPQASGADMSAPETMALIAALFAQAKRDAVGIPEFSAGEADLLFKAFAPIYEVETAGEFDRIGQLRWGAREAPEVDGSQPAVYRRIAFTRYGQTTLVQIVYLIWFSQRPAASWLDPVSGTLDGLFFRVTLDRDGRPLVYDSIHPCGCYHMFFPTPLATPVAPPDPSIEWAFVPRTLPAVAPPQRIVLRLTSGSHALTDIRVEPATVGAGVPYPLRDEAELRTLPTATGPTATGTRSAYGPDGVVSGTERGERFVVWTLGLEDAGAMHEWGHHATATIGRRQFDDADLIERRFAVQPAAEARAGGGR
jgi:hypothetical protein